MKSPPCLGACPGATNGMKTVARGIDIPLWRGGAFSDLGKINEIANAIHLALSERLERFPFERNRSNDKKSLRIKMLEQALIEKVYQLFRSLL